MFVQGLHIASQFLAINVPSHGITPGLEHDSFRQNPPLPFPPGQQDAQSSLHPSYELMVKHCAKQISENNRILIHIGHFLNSMILNKQLFCILLPCLA